MNLMAFLNSTAQAAWFRVGRLDDVPYCTINIGNYWLSESEFERIGGKMLTLIVGAMTLLPNSFQTQEKPRIDNTKHLVKQVCFLSNGKSLISVGNGGPRLWDIETGVQTHHWKWNAYALSLSNDSKFFAAFDAEQFVRIVDLTSKKSVFMVKISGIDAFNEPYCALAFSPDGQQLAIAAGRKVELFKKSVSSDQVWTREWSWSGSHEGRSICDIGFVLGGESLAICYRGGWITSVLDAKTGKETQPYTNYKYLSAVAVSRDGKYLATAISGFSNRISFFSFSPKSATKLVFWPIVSPAKNICFSFDGKMLAMLCEDAKVRLINVASGEQIKEYCFGDALPYSIAFSPLGHLAIGFEDKIVVRRITSPRP